MKIVLGPASRRLGEKIASLLNVKTVPVAFKTFPDGESYIRLKGDVHDEEIVVVQTMSYPQDVRFMQLALIVDAAKRNGAKKVTVVVPYLAYARQDKSFLLGEAVSIETVARMLKAAGVDRLITVNVHDDKVLLNFPFPATSVSAIPLLAEKLKKKGYQRAFDLAPDKGAARLAEEAKIVLGGE